jgi:hypothetical protein
VNKLTFYEQVGIVIPGSVFLFGLLLFFPALQTVFMKDGVTVGELGIFVLLSYARWTSDRSGWKCGRELLVGSCRRYAVRLGNENANIAAIRSAN